MGSRAVSYAERERRFFAARGALSRSGARVARALAAEGRVPPGLEERLREEIRLYRAAERPYFRARRRK